MLEEMSNWATIILMLAMVKIVWQLEYAAKILEKLHEILIETANDYNE
jgi:hypothetical protein